MNLLGSPHIDADAAALLHDCRTASLATVDDAGAPHAANVQFAIATGDAPATPAPAGPYLVFVSSPRSAHARHIQRDGRVALAIYHHDDRPDQIRGLQLHGRADALSPDTADWHAARRAYLERFTFILANPLLLAAMQAQTLYRVRPTWIRWIDNRKGFGYHVERTLGDSQQA